MGSAGEAGSSWLSTWMAGVEPRTSVRTARIKGQKEREEGCEGRQEGCSGLRWMRPWGYVPRKFPNARGGNDTA